MGTVFSCCLPAGRVVQLNDRRLRVLECIGEGGFSYVYRVQDMKDGKIYALKKMFLQSKEQLQDAQWEIEVHHSLHNPHCMQLIDHGLTVVAGSGSTKEISMLMPFYKRGSLHSLLMALRRDSATLPEADILRLFIGICEGVLAFHRHDPPWAHRDIKPANVLLGDDDTPVLVDFGSTAPARVTVTSRSQALAIQELAAERCTPQYRPPELFDVKTGAVLDERTDVWALGCTLYAMAFLQSPFEAALGQFGGSIGLAVLSGRYSFKPGHRYSRGFCDLIAAMLHPDIQQRPFVDEIIRRARDLLYDAAGMPAAADSTPAAVRASSGGSASSASPAATAGGLAAAAAASAAAAPASSPAITPSVSASAAASSSPSAGDMHAPQGAPLLAADE